MSNLLNFDLQFVKYGAFHTNKINQRIHMIFVPTILWSALVWFSRIQISNSWALGQYFPLNGAFVLGSIYALYYLALNFTFGVLALPYVYGLTLLANLFQNSVKNAIPISISVHLLSWVFQIYGHQVHEGRAPAFTQDPIQVLAPLFVFCELIFSFGLFSETSQRLEKMCQMEAKKAVSKKMN